MTSAPSGSEEHITTLCRHTCAYSRGRHAELSVANGMQRVTDSVIPYKCQLFTATVTLRLYLIFNRMALVTHQICGGS